MKKKKIITLSTILVSIIAIFFVYKWFTKPTLEESYLKQNFVFWDACSTDYLSLNSDLTNRAYAVLNLYKKDHKTTLTIQDIEEYLSQEYEEDGSIRIFNNGSHKELEKFINWGTTSENKEIINNYFNDLENIYNNYLKTTYPCVISPYFRYIHKLSYGQVDQLIEKYYNPEYQLEYAFREILNNEYKLYNFIFTEQDLYYYLQSKIFFQSESTKYNSFENVDKKLLVNNLERYNSVQEEYNTGRHLTIEDIENYLSQEYEEDGSIRIFNNGKHPEIYDYELYFFFRSTEYDPTK